MNHSQHKRDLELYNSFMRAAGEGDRSQKPSDTKKLLSSMGITASAGFGPTTGSEASKQTFIGNFNKVLSLKDALSGMASTVGQRAGGFQTRQSPSKLQTGDYAGNSSTS